MDKQRDKWNSIDRHKALSVKEFAAQFGCSPRHVWTLIHTNIIGHLRIGRRVVLLPVHIDEFVARYSKPAV